LSTQYFVTNSGAAQEWSMIDFADNKTVASWYSVNDGVMGGVSESAMTATSSGTAIFSGVVRFENNGGFASVRSKPAELNIKAGDAIVVRVKGDGREYVLNLYTKSRRMAFSYRAPLPTVKNEWTEVTVPLEDFIPTAFGDRVQGMGPVEPNEITSIGFMLSDKKAGPFKMEVAWVKLGKPAHENPAGQ
jgi:monofunctional biosynthetic peptidoglycan transglycosylase